MNEVSRVELRTSGYTFLHDFALTPTHYVLMVCPVALDPALFLLGVDSAAGSVKWQEGKPAEVHLLGRPLADPAAAAAAGGTPRTQQQQQQRHQSGNGHSNGAGNHNSRQESVEPSMHRQQSKQQQQQQGLSRRRHSPEHLISQVGKLQGSP